jgi:hypothetical protein
MKSKLFRDLKPGEKFLVEVGAAGYAWNYNSGIRFKRLNEVFTVRPGGIIVDEEGENPVTGKRDELRTTSAVSYDIGNQVVSIVDPNGLTPDRIVQIYSSRVGETTGSDPEIFVEHGQGETKSLLPAFRFLPKQKKGVTPLGTPYADGFAVEFGTTQTHCHGYMIDYLRNGLKSARARAVTYDRTAKLTMKNTFAIPKIMMDNAKDEDVALGCTPSLNVYGDSPDIPHDPRRLDLRFAGGHIHLGLPEGTSAKSRENMVKAMDVLAAIPAVAIFASVDNPIRRNFYGRAGEYRVPAHKGLEYRVLSNGWLASPKLAHLILGLTRSAAKIGKAGYHGAFGITEDRARSIINECDTSAAKEFVLKNKDIFHKLLQADGTCSNEDAFQTIVSGGVEAVFPDFDDLVNNWKMDGAFGSHSDNLEASWGALCRNWKRKFVLSSVKPASAAGYTPLR